MSDAVTIVNQLGDNDSYAEEPYRYVLQRRWSDGPMMAFCLTNPSKARGPDDDPTTRKLIGIATRLGAGGYYLVNPYAFSVSKPRNLITAHRLGYNIVGPRNAEFVRAIAQRSLLRFVGGWGGAASKLPPSLLQPTVTEILRYHSIWCYRTTTCGQPVHPLYQAYAQSMEVWMEREPRTIATSV